MNAILYKQIKYLKGKELRKTVFEHSLAMLEM